MGSEIAGMNEDVCCQPGSPLSEQRFPWDEETDRELAALAKAISHPVRIRILRLLAQDPGCMCAVLFEQIPLAQSTVSQHLKVLKEAGLVEGEVDLPRICYCAKTEKLARLKELVSSL
jgi:ArsR family transcriptional regulator, arsenate/arsenite/antimonite-responsive transcriptional repressor